MLGHLDDLVIVPLGLWLAIRLIPPEVLAEHRARAAALHRRAAAAGAVLVVAAWVAAAVLLFSWAAV